MIRLLRALYVLRAIFTTDTKAMLVSFDALDQAIARARRQREDVIARMPSEEREELKERIRNGKKPPLTMVQRGVLSREWFRKEPTA